MNILHETFDEFVNESVNEANWKPLIGKWFGQISQPNSPNAKAGNIHMDKIKNFKGTKGTIDVHFHDGTHSYVASDVLDDLVKNDRVDRWVISDKEIKKVADLKESVNESTHADAARELILLLSKEKPLLAFMKWEQVLINSYGVSLSKAKEISKKIYNKKGQVNQNHLKQLATKELKGLAESVNEAASPGYSKFLVSLQQLIDDIAPQAWSDKYQITRGDVKRIHGSLKKRYGSEYKKFNNLLKTQKGVFGDWYLKESLNEKEA